MSAGEQCGHCGRGLSSAVSSLRCFYRKEYSVENMHILWVDCRRTVSCKYHIKIPTFWDINRVD